MPDIDTTFRVRYAETDQMGVVYYANYFVWMELGRVEYCRAVGFAYREMEAQDGVLLAVIDAQCRYRRPARYDDEVTVRTRVNAASRRGVEFGYEMFVGGEPIAEGFTRHMFLDKEFRPTSLPSKYREMFGVRSA
ncbi:MAG TPA: thioesterase family protein [Bryobacteraceae bacterium]|nr:thioesterase family protein [Bryobacteraceae bacterium]